VLIERRLFQSERAAVCTQHQIAFVADDYLEGYRFVRVLYKFIQ
jgi:hypothetical protein